MSTPSKNAKEDTIDETVFLTLYTGLLQGLVRTSDTRIGLTLAESYFKEQESLLHGKSALPKDFDREGFDYVVTASLLVYCVSIFDAFLSDVTRALLLNNIAALGKTCSVPIEVLASQRARNEIIRKEVEKRVRNIAYSSFHDRLESLSTILSAKLDLEPNDQLELGRISMLRNKSVHDQSLYLFRLDRQHRPSLRKKKDLRKPVAVTGQDVTKATKLFVELGKRIVQKVETNLFGHAILT